MISDKDISDIQKIINYKFNNIETLKECFTHSSYLNKYKSTIKQISKYERLEFLGDRVLGLIIADLIYNKFPNYPEGKMSIKFSYLVRKDFLSKIMTELKLSKFIKISKNKDKYIKNKSILADTLEALIGAIYVDGGYESSSKFISNLWKKHINDKKIELTDPKTILQELSQKKSKKLPIYKLYEKKGSPHSPIFTVTLSCLGINGIIGKGSSKRLAEKKAAENFLKNYNKLNEK